MKKIKLTLEDLKLESFLTEIDQSKVVKMQGGANYGHPADDPNPGETKYGCNDPQETMEGCHPGYSETLQIQCFDTKPPLCSY